MPGIRPGLFFVADGSVHHSIGIGRFFLSVPRENSSAPMAFETPGSVWWRLKSLAALSPSVGAFGVQIRVMAK